ncbi:MAG: thioredoxin family protein [Chloroflexota bacterium]|nr:thioredoxin family protein [Chloroflexota bacterium]
MIKIFFQPQSTENINQIELAEIINNESDVVIEFFSPNCMGCVLSEKAVNEFIEKYSNRYKIIKLNISDKRYAELVSENLVTVTPTFIYYKDGEMIEKYVGMLNDSDKLHEKFNQK